MSEFNIVHRRSSKTNCAVRNKPECRNLIDCTLSYPLCSLTRQFGATITQLLHEVAGLTGVT